MYVHGEIRRICQVDPKYEIIVFEASMQKQVEFSDSEPTCFGNSNNFQFRRFLILSKFLHFLLYENIVIFSIVILISLSMKIGFQILTFRVNKRKKNENTEVKDPNFPSCLFSPHFSSFFSIFLHSTHIRHSFSIFLFA